MTDQRRQDAWDRVLAPWWAKLGFGLVAMLLAVVSYRRFSRVESGSDEIVVLDHLSRLLYEIGGKWTVSIVLVLIGLGFIAWGAAQIARGKHEEPKQR
jgi:hypothetical protein